MARRAVFLDRDGTINFERSFIHNMGRLELLPGAAAAMRRLKEAGFLLVVVTNQSGVARGFFSERQLKRINGRLLRMLRKSGVTIDGLYYCPFHPTAGLKRYRVDSDERKPGPGMLKRAAKELCIDLTTSFMVGDRLSDLAAGVAAGCESLLVRTGYGKKAEQEAKDNGMELFAVKDDLAAAVDWLLKGQRLVQF